LSVFTFGKSPPTSQDLRIPIRKIANICTANLASDKQDPEVSLKAIHELKSLTLGILRSKLHKQTYPLKTSSRICIHLPNYISFLKLILINISKTSKTFAIKQSCIQLCEIINAFRRNEKLSKILYITKTAS